MQGVLPTMLILAVYYTIADMVLLGQMFYYRGFTWRDEVVPPTPKKKNAKRLNGGDGVASNGTVPDERTRLLGDNNNNNSHHPLERRDSDWSDRLTHLNPANPVVNTAPAPPPSTTLKTFAWNVTYVVMVIAAGVLGWWLTPAAADKEHSDDGGNNNNKEGGGEIRMDLWGQIFGWACAALYLGSRAPQLLLNFRRKSVEGLNMLFFLFACLGNLTYVLSIFAFDPKCAGGGDCAPGEAGRLYGRYILVNASWLAGSLGTLFLDMAIFIQFFLYADGAEQDDIAILEDGEADEDGGGVRGIDGERWDQRPILERNMSLESN